MDKATKYLRDKEWSMGNGQCPECCGVPEDWFGHPLHMTPDTIGHKANCVLAAALKGVGEKPLMIGQFKSQIEWEHYITDSGFFSTRHKTAEGCPKYAAFVKPMNDAFRKLQDDILEAVLAPTELGTVPPQSPQAK